MDVAALSVRGRVGVDAGGAETGGGGVAGGGAAAVVAKVRASASSRMDWKSTVDR